MGHINRAVVEKIWRALEASPGVTVGMLAQAVGLNPGDMSGRLATLENNGYLVWEDDYGQLYPYKRVVAEDS